MINVKQFMCQSSVDAWVYTVSRFRVGELHLYSAQITKQIDNVKPIFLTIKPEYRNAGTTQSYQWHKWV